MAPIALYSNALGSLLESIRSWRGNDPVSQLYKDKFSGRIVEINKDDNLKSEWKERCDSKRPPGYKDTSKSDGGIGDFLIWKTLLMLGASHKKDMIFVTNETKSDWFIRSGNEPLYPRPELIAEYREASEGKNLRLCTLHELLREMNVDQKIVLEVKKVETANSAISVAGSDLSIGSNGVIDGIKLIMSGMARIEFAGGLGHMQIISPVGEHFNLHFRWNNDLTIQVLDSNLRALGRIIDPSTNGRVHLSELDTSRKSYPLAHGEAFVAQSLDGQILVGKVVSISQPIGIINREEATVIYHLTYGPEIGIVP